MNLIKTIFFGSTSDSVLTLKSIFNLQLTTGNWQLVGVVTPPPRPVGRRQILTPAPTEVWAKGHKLPVFSFLNKGEKPWLFASDEQVIATLRSLKADLLISASFGQKIPWDLIKGTPLGGLNIHPSLLPRWRGADPVPWAILTGDRQTGVTVVTLSEKFDQGTILAQKEVPITEADFADPLRTKLFALGADLLVEILTTFKGETFKGTPQETGEGTYARRLERDDGFLPWQLLQAAMDGGPISTIQPYSHITIVKDYLRFPKNWSKEKSLGAVVERFFHALHPWPGIWTRVKVSKNHGIKEEKRLKILSCHLLAPSTAEGYHLSLDTVQLGGKKPVSFTQFSSAYLSED